MAKGKKTKSLVSMDEDWKIESALRTITEYNKLSKDKALMKKVAKKANEVAKEAASVASNFMEPSNEIKFGK